MQKQLEGTQNVLMSSADRVAHIDGQLVAIIVSNNTALPAEYKMPVLTKPTDLRMFAGFLF